MAATTVDPGSGKTAALVAAVKAAFGSAFKISRGYIAGHDGVDLAAPEGTPVYAVASGIVEYAKDARLDPHCSRGWACGGGNTVDINIGNKRATQYAHLKSMTVSEGQAVRKGQLIGYVGRTGGHDATGNTHIPGAEFVGAHVHFGLWDHSTNKMVNPTAFLAAAASKQPGGGTGADAGAGGGYLDGWLGVVSYPENTPISAALVDDIMAKLYKAGYFDGPAGAFAAPVVKEILTKHIGQPWNKATQDSIAGQAKQAATNANAPGRAAEDLAASVASIADVVAALADPTKWLYILALIAGAGLAAFGGANVLRAAA